MPFAPKPSPRKGPRSPGGGLVVRTPSTGGAENAACASCAVECSRRRNPNCLSLPLLASQCTSLPGRTGPRIKRTPIIPKACEIPRITCQRDGEQAKPASPTEGRERPLGREYERSKMSKEMPVRIWFSTLSGKSMPLGVWFGGDVLCTTDFPLRLILHRRGGQVPIGPTIVGSATFRSMGFDGSQGCYLKQSVHD